MRLNMCMVAAAAVCGLASAAFAQFADSCGAASRLSEGVYSFDLANATNDYPGTCGATATAPDQWIRYVASGNGTATVSTCGLTAGDSVLTVFDGLCGGSQIGCRDDTCGAQTSISFAVTSGFSYLVRIAGFGGARFAGQVSITRPNDNCSDATSVFDGLVPFDTTGATTDGPNNCGGSKNLWYRYYTLGVGVLTVSTCDNATFDTVLSAYGGCGANLLVCNDDACGVQSSISIPMDAVSEVYISLAGFGGRSGTGQLRFSFNSPDSCQNAPAVGPGVYNFDNTEALSDYFWDNCNGYYDVWFRFVSPGYGWLDASTCGLTTLDTVLSAIRNCGSRHITCNDDACGTQSSISVPVTPGPETLVRLAGYEGFRGTGQVRLAFRSNDNCVNATPVTDGFYGYDTGSATTDGVTVCGNSGNNVWFRYAAPSLGRLNVSTCGLTAHDSVLTAFDGCGGRALACNDDACGRQSSISFVVQPGSTSLISLGGFLGNRGTGQVRFGFVPCRVDFNGDDFLDFFDYSDYVECFESGVCPPGKNADFNGDNFVDFFDYSDFVAAFEAGC